MTKVPIADVVTDRVLPDDADVERLAKQIKESGKIDPILLCEDMTLIDGLRRIRAAESLGKTTIDAVVSSDIAYVAELIRKSHIGVTLTPQRLYEFHVVLIALNNLRARRLKESGTWEIEKRSEADKAFLFNDTIWRILNVPYRSSYTRSIALYRAVLQGNRTAIELLRRVTDKSLSVESASFAFERKGRFVGQISDPQEQRQIIENGLRSILTTINGIRKVKSPVQIPVVELNSYIDRVSELQRHLVLLKRAIRRESRNNEKN